MRHCEDGLAVTLQRVTMMDNSHKKKTRSEILLLVGWLVMERYLEMQQRTLYISTVHVTYARDLVMALYL